MASSNSALPLVYISYADKDKRFLDECKKHLKSAISNKLIDCWDRSEIESGDNEFEKINRAIQSARIAILLISPDYLSSDFVLTNEYHPLLLRDVIIFPVLLSPCYYESTRPLATIRFINDTSISSDQDLIPLDGLNQSKRNKKWLDLIRAITKMLSAPISSIMPYTNPYMHSKHQMLDTTTPSLPITGQQPFSSAQINNQAPNVLIASLGESPVVISAMYDLLKDKKGIILDKVIILHPKDEDVLCAYKLVLKALPEHITVQHKQLDFEDADSWLNTCHFLKCLYETLDTAQINGENVYLSLAGGRKSMAALMAWTAPFFTCIRGLYHITDKDEKHLLTAEKICKQRLSPHDFNVVMHPGTGSLFLVDIPFENGHQIDKRRIARLLKIPDNELESMQYERMEEAILMQAIIQGEKLLDVQVTRGVAEKFAEMCKDDPAGAMELKKHLIIMSQASKLLTAIDPDADTHKIAKPTPLQIFQPPNTSSGLVFYTIPPDSTNSSNDTLGKVVVCAIEPGVNGKFRSLKKIAASRDFSTAPVCSMGQLPPVPYTPPANSVLIVPLGESPMIATQLYTLLKYQEKCTIHEVFLVYPERSIPIENAARIISNAFLQRHKEIMCSCKRVPRLADIIESKDCKDYQEALEEVIKGARKKHPGCEIALALSGGRKSMTAMTIFAALNQNIGYVYHTLITDKDLSERIELKEGAVQALNHTRLSKEKRNARLFLDAYNDDGLYTNFTLFRVPVFPASKDD